MCRAKIRVDLMLIGFDGQFVVSDVLSIDLLRILGHSDRRDWKWIFKDPCICGTDLSTAAAGRCSHRATAMMMVAAPRTLRR